MVPPSCIGYMFLSLDDAPSLAALTLTTHDDSLICSHTHAHSQFCEDKIEASYVPSDDGYPTCPKAECKVSLVQKRREEKMKEIDEAISYPVQ